MIPTKQRYAQIEKEALALTLACKRLNKYLMGSNFKLEMDHKPLVPLTFTKNFEDLPLTVQRFCLRMMRFDYKIQNLPGKELNTADLLPRVLRKDNTIEEELENELS